MLHKDDIPKQTKMSIVHQVAACAWQAMYIHGQHALLGSVGQHALLGSVGQYCTAGCSALQKACYYTSCSMLKEGLRQKQVSILDVRNIGNVLQEARVLVYGQQGALGFDGLQCIPQLVYWSPPTCCPLRQSIGRHDRPASR